MPTPPHRRELYRQRWPRSLPAAGEVAWRLRWAIDERIRRAIHGPDQGVSTRGRDRFAIEFLHDRIRAKDRPASPHTDRVAVIDNHGGRGSLAARACRFYGLKPAFAPFSEAASLVSIAVREGWPLVTVDLMDGEALPEPARASLRAHAESGGTVFVNVGTASSNELHHLFRTLGQESPTVTPSDGTTWVEFSAGSEALIQDFSGCRLHGTRLLAALGRVDRAVELAWAGCDGGRRPVLVEYRIGRGSVLLSTGQAESELELSRALTAVDALATLPPMMAMGRSYGNRVFRPCARLANLTIDDPALRTDRLGIDYDALTTLAEEEDIHITVATIPRELRLADPRVVDILRRRTRLSACYHGNDHSGYEFYLHSAPPSRFRPRSLESQREALRQAVARAEAFTRTFDVALDRVMVFPHGVCEPALLPDLQRAGFLASANLNDREPLGAPPPDDPHLRLRPADTAWAGFPLLWRTGMDDESFVFDLFLGRPALSLAHRRQLLPRVQPVIRWARSVNALGGVCWRSLEEIALHAYLERQDPATGWEVLMFSNEICLHNPTDRPQPCLVHRPHMPLGAALVSEGLQDKEDLSVTVAPRGTRRVKVDGPGFRSLPASAAPCSLFHGA